MKKIANKISAGVFAAGLLSLGVAHAAAAPATKAMADAALKAADAASGQAVKLEVGWTSTAALLKAAHEAETSGSFDDAVKKAKKAEAMAKLSIQEAHEQTSLWQAEAVK